MYEVTYFGEVSTHKTSLIPSINFDNAIRKERKVRDLCCKFVLRIFLLL
jgi:hypothetical protein